MTPEQLQQEALAVEAEWRLIGERMKGWARHGSGTLHAVVEEKLSQRKGRLTRRFVKAACGISYWTIVYPAERPFGVCKRCLARSAT